MSEKTAKLFDLHPWEQILSLNIRPASLQQLLDLAFGQDFHVGEEKSGFQEIAVLVDFADGGIDADNGRLQPGRAGAGPPGGPGAPAGRAVQGPGG